MTHLTETQYPTTQAELDTHMARYKRPRRNTYDGMFPLHEDMELTDEQIQIVQDYIKQVDFHIPGATSDDFLVVRWARYTGFQFLSEDLEAYAIGLRCTAPGFEKHHTFIRMLWGQLMGEPDAPILPVNEPVPASQMMTLNKYRDTPAGPSRTGVDAYETTDGMPGVDFDLKLLNGALADVIAHHATGKGMEKNSWWSPALNWGIGIAGRYPRLKYFEKHGKLLPHEVEALHAFEQRAAQNETILKDLGLVPAQAVVEPTLKQAEKAERGSFKSKLRIRTPRPLTEKD